MHLSSEVSLFTLKTMTAVWTDYSTWQKLQPRKLWPWKPRSQKLWLVSHYSIVFYFIFLYRACSTHLVSSNLSFNLCLWYWFTKIKKSMQTYIVVVSGSILNVSTVHLNGIWHLIWRYLLKPVLGGHPVLSEHYSIPWGCPLNTGFTVYI